MILLWGLAAVLLVVALLFVILPLRKKYVEELNSVILSTDDRDQQNALIYQERITELQTDLNNQVITEEEFGQFKLELERGLLADTAVSKTSEKLTSVNNNSLIIILSVFVLLFSTGLYFKLGASEALSQKFELAEQHGNTDELLSQLRDELKSNPDNPEGWYLLAQMQMRYGRYTQAAQAYESLIKVIGEEGEVLGQYAQALYFAADSQMTDNVQAVLNRALELDPQAQTALGLLGMHAYSQQNYQQAITYWQKVVDTMSDPEEISIMMEGIADAQVRLLAETGQAEVPVSEITVPEITVSEITVNVTLADSLQVDPSYTVFVFARMPNGPPMPLAVQRLQVKDLPTTVTLNDAMAMMPSMTLTSAKQVEVVARISPAGTPAAESGGYEAKSAVLDVMKQPQQNLSLEISQKIP